MGTKISQRATSIKPSPTLAISAKAVKLKKQGKNIISLSAGEPDFDTPVHIKEAAKQAIDQGSTKYTPAGGTPELIEAVVGKFERENQLQYQSEQIIVSCGCKHSLYNMMQALLDPQDEVLIPAPYWVSYPDMVKLAGAKPVIIRTSADKGLKIDARQLEDAINDKTRLLIINSPSNPSGAYYDTDELAALAEVLLAHPQVTIASDDIYEHILWHKQPFQNIVNICPQLYPRSVVLNGVSKAYAMTGWRIGYAAGPEPLIAAMKKIQSQSTSNPSSISQAAARAALEGDQSYIASSNKIFKERHDYVCERINKINGIKCREAAGAFYILIDLQQIIKSMDNINDDVEMTGHLLEKAEVAMVPGSAFGMPGHARISYATDIDNLEQALDRLENIFRQN